MSQAAGSSSGYVTKHGGTARSRTVPAARPEATPTATVMPKTATGTQEHRKLRTNSAELQGNHNVVHQGISQGVGRSF
jgi:hypothetical protein